MNNTRWLRVGLTWVTMVGLGCLGAPKAHAIFFHSLFQTADLYPGMSVFHVALEPNITFTGPKGSGFGTNAHVLFPITPDVTGNVSVGTGTVPFMFDVQVQYSIYPDFEKQVAFSLGGGLAYLRHDQSNHVSVYLYPIVSKTFFLGGFVLTPYLYLPIGLTFFKRQVDTPIKVALGARFINKHIQNLLFFCEAGIGVLDAPMLVSFGLSYRFEGS